MSSYTHSGQVYFVACGSYVKIGYCATAIEKRMKELQSGGRLVRPVDLDRSAPLRILRLIPNCIMRDERRIHDLFAAHHEVGEWYRLSPAFIRHLQRLQFVPDREVLLGFRRARRDLKNGVTRIARQDAA